MTTIKDIAEACGVSKATVSYVLNGTRTLLPETREKVLRAMREMDYHPSAVARGLSSKRMHTLGILFGVVDSLAVINNPYASSILQGVLTASSAAGYNVTFFTDPWRSAHESAKYYRDQRTDGILVVAPPLDSDMVSGLVPLGIPLVAISFPGEALGVPAVDVDDVQGTRLAVRHLRALGHSRIAHLSGPQVMLSGLVRQETFCAVMEAEGLPVPAEYLGPGRFSLADCYAQTRRLMALPRPPTALFAANDDNAVGAMNAAHDLGLDVPRQLSIVGYDDIPASSAWRPGLTSVHQPLQAMGVRATQLLLDLLNGCPVAPGLHYLEPTLIVRETTAPPLGAPATPANAIETPLTI